MREIGGYIEFEHFQKKMLHANASYKVRSARDCIALLVKARGIKTMYLPYYQCSSITELLTRLDVKPEYYEVGEDFLPKHDLPTDEAILLVDYYGQLETPTKKTLAAKYPHAIMDNTQSYFSEPVKNMDTIYSCRKYFGVADGGLLYTTATIEQVLKQGESFERMNFLLGRFERTASEFYQESLHNNDIVAVGEPERMSKLTENLLRALDYDFIKKRRGRNYAYLHARLKGRNQLRLKARLDGAFAYPLVCENAPQMRQKLIEQKIYIPQLWPNVVRDCKPDSTDYRLSNNILPLPVDQRYNLQDMHYMLDVLERYL